MGRRNNFQIEVGIANLAFAHCWPDLRLYVGGGMVAEASAFLAFGFYLEVRRS